MKKSPWFSTNSFSIHLFLMLTACYLLWIPVRSFNTAMRPVELDVIQSEHYMFVLSQPSEVSEWNGSCEEGPYTFFSSNVHTWDWPLDIHSCIGRCHPISVYLPAMFFSWIKTYTVTSHIRHPGLNRIARDRNKQTRLQSENGVFVGGGWDGSKLKPDLYTH